MQSLTQALFDYAQEQRAADHLWTQEYRRLISGLEEEWEALCGALPPDQGQRLESLMARQAEAGWLEDRASFLAGVSVGLELARL